VGADFGSVNNELGEVVGLEPCSSKLLFCFFNAVLFKLLVDFEKVFLCVSWSDFLLPSPFEVYTIF
jgi:hypothetical protein